MGFVQRDILLRQIEQLAGAIVRRLTDKPVLEQRYEINEEEIARAAGLSLDVAAGLPFATIDGLLHGDPRSLLVLGLGLVWRGQASQGRALIEAAHARSPSLLGDAEWAAVRAEV